MFLTEYQNSQFHNFPRFLKHILKGGEYKHLGIVLSQNAKWTEHLENIIANITKHLGILRN
jgi:hypothetical protein